MSKVELVRRFGPERWVTLRETGEHVQVEAWSPIASAYRVRSRRRGVFLAGEDTLDELPVHPGVELGRHWNRCAAVGCGAPLTPDRPTCVRCDALTCWCGRCGCVSSRTKRPTAGKTRKKAAKAA